MTKKKMVNLKQLSKIMQVTQTTLRDWVSKGMPAQRTAKGFLCDVDEMFKWREQYLVEKKKNSSGYDEAKTERMLWLSKLARLNYERESGLLVEAKFVNEWAFSTCRLLRDQLLNIPNRIASILTAEQDAKKSHTILDKELRQCLIDFVDTMSKGIGKTKNESEVTNESSQK